MKLILSLVLLLLSYQTQACDIHGKSGIVADNDLWIGEGARDANITQEQFNQIIDEVAAHYRPVIEAKGKKLELVKNWSSGTVNAYAQQKGEKWIVSMFGGLARHATVTPDAFALVVCHELGHHLGGAPKKTSYFGGSYWASNEGQADYWGNLKCMRKYFAGKDNDQALARMEVPKHAQDKCEAAFKTAEEVAICSRSAMAGLSLGELFRALRKQETPIKFDTPSQKKVSKTSHSHPASQCRLDTYFHGSLCDKDIDVDVDVKNPKVGTCVRSDNYTDGVRPLCWYKP